MLADDAAAVRVVCFSAAALRSNQNHFHHFVSQLLIDLTSSSGTSVELTSGFDFRWQNYSVVLAGSGLLLSARVEPTVEQPIEADALEMKLEQTAAVRAQRLGTSIVEKEGRWR